MAVTSPPEASESEFESLEHRAAEHMGTEHLSDIDTAAQADGEGVDDLLEAAPATLRLSIAVAATTLAAAIMAGGIFVGTSPRIYAAIAGIAGVALAAGVSRVRNPFLTLVFIVGGIFLVGLAFIVPSGADKIPDVASIVREATRTAKLNRPPAEFLLGWRVVIGWLLAMVGFAGAWVALVVRRPALGIFVPLPATAIAAISVPRAAQLPSGIVALLLFAVGLGLLSSVQSFQTGEDRPSAGYELRRALRALPLLIALTVGLVFLAKANILFPRPLIDPAQEAQKPKTVPLSAVEDRVLFTVNSQVTGPWRMGTLDVYDGRDWRLPAFSQNRLNDVPASGVVDKDLVAGVRATFTVAGLSGTVLPSLPNTIGIIAEGPKLAYDSRNGNIRLASGTIQPDVSYTVTAPALPSVNDLRAVTAPPPAAVSQFLSIPPPPPAVQSLLAQAKTKGDDKWSQIDFLRTYVLDNITASGPGTPVSITPDRVQEILSSTKEASPFEIVAIQAMLARWVGVPGRIGYGFDGGDQTAPNTLEIRPKNGATFLEVYFSGYKWLPVVGTPKKAKPTVGKDSQTQTSPNITPSDEVSVQLFLPTVVAPKDPRTANIIRGAFAAVAGLLVLLLAYYLWPALNKAFTRARRRSRAMERGPSARIANAYAEWRDTATDFGYQYASDTPLMFVEHFAGDDEHSELAWLVTRSLWGDLREPTVDQAVAAETLAKSLKSRLADAHPGTVRFVSRLSRLSMRHPYSTDAFVLNVSAPRTSRRERKREAAIA